MSSAFLEPDKPTRHGFYSALQECDVGAVIYLDQQSKKVKVTIVRDTNTPEQWKVSYPDMVYIGIVTTFVKRLHNGKNEKIDMHNPRFNIW